MKKKNRAVFLDRDGTILNEKGYLKDPKKIRFYPSAFRGLRNLQRAGFRLVVVTNQSGLGRGIFTQDDLNAVHRTLTGALKKRGIRLSGIYFCPHKPEAGCACRKPKPKLPRLAARKLNLDLRQSFVIGDQDRDLRLAKAIQAKGILVLTGWGRRTLKKIGPFSPVCSNLESASKWILNE